MSKLSRNTTVLNDIAIAVSSTLYLQQFYHMLYSIDGVKPFCFITHTEVKYHINRKTHYSSVILHGVLGYIVKLVSLFHQHDQHYFKQFLC